MAERAMLGLFGRMQRVVEFVNKQRAVRGKRDDNR